MTTTAQKSFFDAIATAIAADSQFASVTATESELNCAAPNAVPATYSVTIEDANIFVALHTPDRWLSESIEAELEHTGDELEELLEDELIELGSPQTQYTFQHFRDDQKRYIFRTPIALSSESDLINPSLIKQVADLLIAYQLAFVELGDMPGDDD